MEERKGTVALISFTGQGGQVNKALREGLEHQGYVCQSYEKRRDGACQRLPMKVEEPLEQWAGRRLKDSRALIFIGAAGIAVRAIAPWVKDKWTDPAVLVVDESGHYVIPILSGHVGGANELAVKAARILKGVPVITTATDLHHCFAVDVFAAKNGLQITDRELAKELSARILEGDTIGLFSDYPLEGAMPGELADRQALRHNIWITRRAAPLSEGGMSVLRLVPKTIHIGVGCRRGIPAKQVRTCVLKVLEQKNCAAESVAAVASIDLKDEEPGLLELARYFNVPYRTFTAQELDCVEGAFGESDFVRQVTGVGNVCERAALRSVGQGRILCSKQVFAGVTVALAEEEWKGTFYHE